MLNFIYQDQRYKSAGSNTKKTRAALFIILDFISSKLLDSISWLLTATMIYILLVVFYSNMVLFTNITLRMKGLMQIVYTLGAILAAAIFILFALLIVAYVIASITPLFRAKSSGAPSRTMETFKRQKAYGYAKNVWDNIAGIFSWKASGEQRNLIALVLLSIVAFYHAWLTIPTANIRAYKYNFLPDSLMHTSRELYRSTYPTVSKVIGYITDMFNYAWKFIAGYLDKLF